MTRGGFPVPGPDYLAERLAELGDVTKRTGWEKDALCREVDGDLFYVDKGGNARPAYETCHRCEVQDQCLLASLIRREEWGIFGGQTERSRRRYFSDSSPEGLRLRRAISEVA